jgi:hypothetical protein
MPPATTSAFKVTLLQMVQLAALLVVCFCSVGVNSEVQEQYDTAPSKIFGDKKNDALLVRPPPGSSNTKKTLLSSHGERGLRKKKKKKKVKSTKRCKRSRKTKKATKNLPKQCRGIDTSWKPDFPTPSDPTDPNFLLGAKRCGLALQNSGFNLFDISLYSQWFDDESILSLSMTGFYQGPASIAEYVNFVNYFPNYYRPVEGQTIPFSVDGNKCTFLSGIVNSLITATNESADAVVGLRLQFTITDDQNIANPQSITMNRVELNYPSGFMEYLFGTLLRTQAMAEEICTIQRTHCFDQFKLENCYDPVSIDECVNDVLSLPGVEDGGFIDGKSMGCRVLHQSFVPVNAAHCPHISFIPKYDENCFLKCQESKKKFAEDFFLEEELQFFAAYGAAVGLGEDQWASPSMFPLQQPN